MKTLCHFKWYHFKSLSLFYSLALSPSRLTSQRYVRSYWGYLSWPSHTVTNWSEEMHNGHGIFLFPSFVVFSFTFVLKLTFPASAWAKHRTYYPKNPWVFKISVFMIYLGMQYHSWFHWLTSFRHILWDLCDKKHISFRNMLLVLVQP